MGRIPLDEQEKVCGLPYSVLKKLFLEYQRKTEDKEITLPSLPHFLSSLPEYVGEDDLQRYLIGKREQEKDTQSKGEKLVLRIFQWFRGQYLSNPSWSGQQAQKAVIALAKDYGDGVRYSSKEKVDNSPNQLNISFGDSEMSQKAGR